MFLFIRLSRCILFSLYVSKASNAAKASESAHHQAQTMLPGAPWHLEIQQLAMAHALENHKESAFVKEAVSIGYSLQIPMGTIDSTHLNKQQHYLPIQNVLDCLVERFPKKIFGGASHPDNLHFKASLKSWWNAFRALAPEHDIFQRFQSKLDTVIPMKMHMDEGTGLRRSAVMQFSWGPVIAESGNSLDRYFFFLCINGEEYKKYHSGYAAGNKALDDLHARLAEECEALYLQGIWSKRFQRQIHLCFVALEGDLPAQARAFRVTRNFACTPNSMCPWCNANDVDLPYTDTRPSAAWRSTISMSRPWSEQNPSPLCKIPSANRETFLAKDLFHLCHLGHVRTFSVNALAYLVSENHFAT